jgi:chromosome segregation ATPase
MLMLENKENELKRAQMKIQSLKKGISQMKKQIDNAYDVEKTLVLENEFKDHQNNYEKLVSEVESLKKVEKEQNKAFAILNNDEDADRRLQSIKEEVHNAKNEAREKNEQLRKIDEELKNQHSQTIEMEQK